VHAAQHESDRVPVDFSPINSVQRQKIFRDLPMYCDSAALKPCKEDAATVGAIAFFRSGKSDDDLKEMNTIIGILLDRAAYEEAPFAGKKLANEMTKFLWHFKGRLDFEVWQLLEQNFDMAFVVLKADLSFMKEYMQEIIAKLDQLSGPVPFYSIGKTERYIRSKLREYSAHQVGIVSLKREILEVQLREAHKLEHDEYIPFYESLFIAWNAHGLKLLHVNSESIRFEAMEVPEEQEIEYDEEARALRIREDTVKLAANAAKQQHLAAVIAKNGELGRKWLYDEIIEDIDHDQPTFKLRKSYSDAAYQLNEKIRKDTGIKGFLVKTSKSVKIDERHLI
jgi:hypothetical protein